MQTIAILGSTGSIGTQALELVRLHPEEFRVVALTARSSREKLFEQVREFRPEVAGLTEPIPMSEIPEDVRFCRWVMGADALHAAAAEVPADMVLVSVVGIAGLQSVMDALGANRQVLLANKEALVTGGHLVMDAAKRISKPILPVDSEHSAIFQCLQGCADRREIKRLILTCSGGPFFGKRYEELEHMTPADALKHPNWSMGAKITVDSATLMNKGLEVIEAMRLYGLPLEQVDAVIHRQSVIHSLVEFRDGALLAQLGTPDMKLPIRYAMTYPHRAESPDAPLDLLKCGALTFDAIDETAFRCFALARQCAKEGGTACATLNAANEEAVWAFLRGETGFNGIHRTVEATLAHLPVKYQPSLADILEADRLARETARAVLSR